MEKLRPAAAAEDALRKSDAQREEAEAPVSNETGVAALIQHVMALQSSRRAEARATGAEAAAREVRGS